MNVVITGASRGIGFDCAMQLASLSNFRVLALSRNETALQQLQERAIGANYLSYLKFDLTNPDTDALLEAVHKLGGVDILINNAGLLINKTFSELQASDWEQVFKVNILGPAALIRILLPYLEQSNHAHILNISSMGGFQGSSKFPGLSAYSSSKAALSNLTECLAEEFKDKNIAVNCLALGAVQTEMLNEAFPGYKAPLSSEEMASFFVYFATQGHRFFNGKILPVSVSTP